MSVADELDKLNRMRDDGTITDEQYERARAKLLDGEDEDRRPRRRRDDDPAGEELSPSARKRKVREWGLMLHLSQLAGYVVPLAGIVAPILIWQLKKDELPELDEHGKHAANWLLSSLIYLMVCIPLCFVIVGIPLLAVLLVLDVVFPIMAAVKANEGKTWRYPLSMAFFK